VRSPIFPNCVLRLTRLALRPLERPIGELLWWVVTRHWHHQEFDGFCLVDWVSDPKTREHWDLFFSKTTQALQLVFSSDPKRLARMRRDMPRVVLVSGGGNLYTHGWRACELDVSQLPEATPLSLSVTLVHEATHARLCKAGITYWSEDRQRVEAACLGSEAAYARRLPDSAELRELLKWRQESLRKQWWTDYHLLKRKLGRAQADRLPRWARRFIMAVYAAGRGTR